MLNIDEMNTTLLTKQWWVLLHELDLLVGRILMENFGPNTKICWTSTEIL